ncbi:hypothetical protein MHYP_G00016190 [Metynnis hypsauchen]
MIVRPRSLLGLLVILYLQSCAVGQNPPEPKECCFSCWSRPIPISVITKCEEMGPDCPRAGVIFTIKNKWKVCVDPSVEWVQRIMKKIDCQTVIKNFISDHRSSPPGAEAAVMIVRPRSLLLGLLVILYLQSCAVGQNPPEPKECCFSFWSRPIPSSVITKCEEMRCDCPRAGVIFTIKNKWKVCVKPGVKWVQQIMKKIDCQTVIKNLYCKEEQCCLTTNKGHDVCVDPSLRWVRRLMERIDRRIVENSGEVHEHEVKTKTQPVPETPSPDTTADLEECETKVQTQPELKALKPESTQTPVHKTSRPDSEPNWFCQILN